MGPNGSLRVLLHCHINMDYCALIRVDFGFPGLLIRVSWLLTHTIISHYSPCELIFIPRFIISMGWVRPRIRNTSRNPKLRQWLDVTKDWFLSPYATLMPEAWCPGCWIRPGVSMSPSSVLWKRDSRLLPTSYFAWARLCLDGDVHIIKQEGYSQTSSSFLLRCVEYCQTLCAASPTLLFMDISGGYDNLGPKAPDPLLPLSSM